MERYPGQRAGYISWQVGSFLTLLVVPLLFLPKINLVAVAGENAGLRIDDFVLAIALCTVIASFLLCRRAWITKQEIFLTLFMGLGAVSAIFNGTSILYALRLLEYFTLFYVGLHARRWLSLRSIVLAFLYLNFVLIFLQAIRVIGSFPLGEYKVGVPIGIGSGNWEIGLLLNICIATLAFGGFPQRRMVLPHMLITMAALFIVGSRTPAVSCLALVLLYLTRKHLTNRGGLIAIAATVVILAGAGWGAADELANSSLVRRVAPLLTTDYGAAIDDVWRSTEPRDQYVDETEAYEILMQSGATYDLSLIIRGAKVIGALKYFSNRGPLE
ncbi:MAG TPA: hypothetical protein VKQ29_05910, partial [Aliidongia sp.]|nr:hypothetical protein [Aliidongia sp.]